MKVLKLLFLIFKRICEVWKQKVRKLKAMLPSKKQKYIKNYFVQ